MSSALRYLYLPKSQSHLYGIENHQGRHAYQCGGVSIAPLWNWKIIITHHITKIILSQSHLYGIEKYTEVGVSYELLVSIAPLWNWKCKKILPFWNNNSLNRTFMELKKNTLIMLWGIHNVSIAPLWNWKTARPTTTAHTASLNRTFMELKIKSAFNT